MLSHKDIWAAIDALAKQSGLSPSGLARRAGLDPTTFNLSKRLSPNGRPRWPSTESLAKILDATGTSIQTMAYLLEKQPELEGSHAITLGESSPPLSPTIPRLRMDASDLSAHFDKLGKPIGKDWEEIPFPLKDAPHSYALEVIGDALSPFYRDRDTLIVSLNAPIRKGDKIIMGTPTGDLKIQVMHRRNTQTIEISHLDMTNKKTINIMSEVEWIARITWATQ